MDKTSTPYTQYTSHHTFGGVDWAELLIESGMLRHEDIPVFSFAPLEQIRQDLLDAGYSHEEVDSTIAGLKQLPEYENSQRDTTSRG